MMSLHLSLENISTSFSKRENFKRKENLAIGFTSFSRFFFDNCHFFEPSNTRLKLLTLSQNTLNFSIQHIFSVLHEKYGGDDVRRSTSFKNRCFPEN